MKNESIRNTIGSNIERLMHAAPDIKTDTTLSARSGIPLSTLRRILAGAIDVNVDTLDALAQALKVNASALLASTVDPLAQYQAQIAALPADQQKMIQEFVDSVMAQHEELPVH